LHALVIAGTWMPVSQAPVPPARLEARLVALPPAKPPPAIAAAPRAREKRANPAAAAVTASAPAIAPAPAEAPAMGAADLPVTPEPQREGETAAAEPVAPEPPQHVALAAESSTIAAAVRSLPRRGRIAYNVLYGDSRFAVGRTVQTWEVAGDSYRLASEAETSGVVDLFRPQRLRYMSQGRVMTQGLRPDSFVVSRTRRGRNEASQARFDWNAGQLTYGTARDQKHVALPPGTQDLMSLMFQFSLAPPARGRHRLPITTGTRFEFYEIEVAGEESIETPIGALRALPVKQIVRAGSESIEFWLAAEYRYLPVKIRHYDREGNFSGEQVVSEIRISEE
jgi:hypothetical protein